MSVLSKTCYAVKVESCENRLIENVILWEFEEVVCARKDIFLLWNQKTEKTFLMQPAAGNFYCVI